jgi:antitoxin component YwqK of YwqJK toxin-antitoxin module
VTNENVLLSKGNYLHGKKHGYFEIYHPNGKLSCKGNYLNDRPIGQWEFFYEDESPERILNITESDTLLMRFVDKKGNLKVIEGNGEFNGTVAGNASISSAAIAKGKIENGKPHGKWTSTIYNAVLCTEEFDHGKFIRGISPNSPLDGKKEYKDKSFINSFFLPNYLKFVETFRVAECADPVLYSSKKYAFDIQRFNSDLRLKIDRVLENDFRTGRASDYTIGNNYLTIQFSVNKEGKAENFKQLTPWGQQFFNSISSGISSQARFPEGTKTMFFHLKLYFPGGNSYRYSFQFSRNSSFN